MTSEFSKLTIEVEGLKDLCEDLINDVSQDNEKVEKYQTVKDKLESMVFKIAKYRKRVNEKDPDKQTLGPQMKIKVEAFIEKFDTLYNFYEEELKEIYDRSAIKKINLEIEQQKAKEALEENNRFSMINEIQAKTKEEENRRAQKLREQQDKEKERQKLLESFMSEESLKEQLRQKRLEDAIKSFTEYTSTLEPTPKILFLDGLRRLNSLEFDHYRSSLGNLADFITQLNSNPSQITNRIVRLENPQFVEKIGQYPGSLIIFKSLGFVMVPAKNLSKQLAEMEIKNYSPESLYLYLEEPESTLAGYEVWIKWVENIQMIRDFIQLFIQKSNQISREIPSNKRTQAMIDFIETHYQL